MAPLAERKIIHSFLFSDSRTVFATFSYCVSSSRFLSLWVWIFLWFTVTLFIYILGKWYDAETNFYSIPEIEGLILASNFKILITGRNKYFTDNRKEYCVGSIYESFRTSVPNVPKVHELRGKNSNIDRKTEEDQVYKLTDGQPKNHRVIFEIEVLL